MRTILITGANRGIGLEFVKQYSENNWRVLACCCQVSDLLNVLANDPNRNIQIFQLNVIDNHNITQLADVLANESIDIFLNNAGILGTSGTRFGDAEFGAVNIGSWIEAFKTNTIAPVMLAQCFVEHIASSQKKIIANMSSNMASIKLCDQGGEYVYRSSKAALNMVTKSMAIDLKSRGIIVVALHPGWVKTDTGGPHAKIEPQESVKGLRSILDSVSLTQSGSFIAYNGHELPW